MDNSQKIICPIITVWILLALNCLLFYSYLIYIFSIIKGFDGLDGYTWFIILSLLINFLIELIASILVTISFENKKFRLYLIGLIMSLVFDIYITVYIFVVGEGRYYYRGKIRITFNTVLLALIEWTIFIVLIIYYKRVKSLFNKTYLNPSLINDFPSEIQTPDKAVAQNLNQNIYI